ncbi:MAG TPA: hypothetical protein IGR64_04160 [Leptolyngbyaceae cyanobacterium M65_K2018_010]|nr:hypothetical protein [Leptolyngbyaceae cyanobacterium M65_K2018_010]
MSPTKPVVIQWLSGWSGGGLLLLLSLGLHSLVLGIPLPTLNSPEEPVSLGPVVEAPTATIDVVRVPPMPAPATPTELPVSSKPPLVAPPPAPSRPLDPSAPSPTTPPPEPPKPSTETSPPPGPSPAPEVPTRPQGLVYNHQVKTLPGDTRGFLAWYSEQDWSDFALPPLPGQQELPPLLVSYDQPFCLEPPPAPGRLEVIVASDGRLARTPRVLGTTGYPDLDGWAVEQARGQDFTTVADGASPSPRVYWLPVDVRYSPNQCTP